jgi:hypothetical protein
MSSSAAAETPEIPKTAIMPAKKMVLPLDDIWSSFTITAQYAHRMEKNGERSLKLAALFQDEA